MPNHPALGKAGIGSRLTIGHHFPGLPEPGRWANAMRVALFFILTFLSVTSMIAMDMFYHELPANTVTNMSRQRAFVELLAKRHKLGLSVTRTKADFDLLELILSKKLVKKDQAWELQSLGVVFGDALVSEEPKLRWMEVADAWGTDPALLYGDTCCFGKSA